jgi:catechol 2,3-dioxygenase-like lactoylglutathione lyase family enzyme
MQHAQASAKLVMSLLAGNLARTLQFYLNLGFHLSGGSVENGWIELCLGSAVLQFYSDPPKGTAAPPQLSGTIYVHVSQVDQIAKQLETRAAFEWGPEDMDYGMREFAVRDPNGYILAFAAPSPRG